MMNAPHGTYSPAEAVFHGTRHFQNQHGPQDYALWDGPASVGSRTTLATEVADPQVAE